MRPHIDPIEEEAFRAVYADWWFVLFGGLLLLCVSLRWWMIAAAAVLAMGLFVL